MSASFIFTTFFSALTVMAGALAFFWVAEGWSAEGLWPEPAVIELDRSYGALPMEGVVFEENHAPSQEEIERDRRTHQIFSI